MEHVLAKTILIDYVINIISKEYKITIIEARDKLYKSPVIDYIDDDETGLFGESPLYVYSLFEKYEKST